MRQAISIDERRCMFRLKKWDERQTFMHNRFNNAKLEPVASPNACGSRWSLV
jgi:hypothetical protein